MKYCGKQKWLTCILASSMVLTSLTGCGGKGDEKAEEVPLKECVYDFEMLSCMEQIKGDISDFRIKDDEIYVYTTEWEEWKEAASEDGAEEEIAPEEETEGEATPEDGAEGEESSEDGTEEESSEDGAEGEESSEDGTEGEEAPEDETEGEGISEEPAEDEMMIDEDYDPIVTERFYSINADGTEATELFSNESHSSEGYLLQFDVGKDGDIYLLYNSYTEDANSYYVNVLDNKGNEKTSFDVGEALEEDESYIQSMCLDGSDNVCMVGDTYVYVFDKTGKKQSGIKGENYIYGLAVTNDGGIIITTWTEEGLKVAEVDMEGKKMGDLHDVRGSVYSGDALVDGAGEYSYYINDSTAVYGCDLKNDKSKKLLDWVGSNIDGRYIGKLRGLENGNFVASYYDYSKEDNSENGLYILKKVDPSQVVEKQTITFAGIYVDDQLRSQAVAFNKSQDKYQVIVKDYTAEEDPYTKMNADLVAGDVPDLIDLSGIGAQKYISKGMLADLYPLMEKDAEISKDDFIDNILKVMETDGKLYHIAPSFGIDTLIGRASDIKGRDHLTIQDIKDLEAEKGKESRSFYMSANKNVLYSLCQSNYTNYIDWLKGECHFTDSDFADILEYANTYPAEEEIDYEDRKSYPEMIRSGELIFADCYSISMEEVELYSKMFEDEIEFIGYPSNVKNGAAIRMNTDIGIYAKSENQEGAWAFLRTLLTEEYISGGQNNWYMSGFPLRKDCLENEIQKVTATERYTDKFGHEIDPLNSTWGYDTLEVEIKPLTEKEVSMIRKLIDSADHLISAQEEVIDIILEEADSYFNGQKSKEEVTEIIQNRVSTYVNENR